MNEQINYVLTQDTKMLFSQIGREENSTRSTNLDFAINNYQKSLKSSVLTAFNNNVDITTHAMEDIDQELHVRASRELSEDPNLVCICVDRSLLSGLEALDEYKGRFFRFEICRAVDDNKVPRPKKESFSNQAESLRKSIPNLAEKKLMLVDSGVMSGGTMKEFINILKKNGINNNIKKILCGVGDPESISAFQKDIVEIVKPTENMLDWIDTRDFSPLGGKILSQSKSNGATSTIPYIYPWDEGNVLKLTDSPNLFSLSKNAITAFRVLIAEYEKGYDKPLTFRELLKKGFSLPTNINKDLPISINDTLLQYLDRCLVSINREQNRSVAIFDMDGTLYQLDGKNNGFSGSSLDQQVQKNALQFIIDHENCSNEEAEKVLREGIADDIGLSAYLSRKYSITRHQYFDTVWNISPEGIIKNDAYSKKVISDLKKDPSLKIVLLTHSPRVWAMQVLKYLQVDQYFETVYTGDRHGQKNEVFEMLSKRYKPSNIISIGDQYETDLFPAKNLGMHTYQIYKPEDLNNLPTQLLRALNNTGGN